MVNLQRLKDMLPDLSWKVDDKKVDDAAGREVISGQAGLANYCRFSGDRLFQRVHPDPGWRWRHGMNSP